MKTDELIDFDRALNIQDLKCVTIDKDSDSFFILANKMEQQLGFFLFKIKYDKPKKPKFKIIMKNKLDIGNCNMIVSLNPAQGLKELIISYKSIYVNTYQVMVVDLAKDNKSKHRNQKILFRHESFQRWESTVSAFVIQRNKDICILNSKGIHMISFGAKSKKPIYKVAGEDRMSHSLDSFQFLKLEPQNHILFESKNKDQQMISIQQEYSLNVKSDADENIGQIEKAQKLESRFQAIYKIRYYETTIKDLLLF